MNYGPLIPSLKSEVLLPLVRNYQIEGQLSEVSPTDREISSTDTISPIINELNKISIQNGRNLLETNLKAFSTSQERQTKGQLTKKEIYKQTMRILQPMEQYMIRLELYKDMMEVVYTDNKMQHDERLIEMNLIQNASKEEITCFCSLTRHIAVGVKLEPINKIYFNSKGNTRVYNEGEWDILKKEIEIKVKEAKNAELQLAKLFKLINEKIYVLEKNMTNIYNASMNLRLKLFKKKKLCFCISCF